LVGWNIARFFALALDLEMRHAAARVPKISDLELAQLLAAQRVVKQCRQDRAVALGLDGLLRWRREKLAGLVIADRRRRAFATLGLRPLDALDRIVGDGVLVAQIFEQRRQRREAVADRAAGRLPFLGGMADLPALDMVQHRANRPGAVTLAADRGGSCRGLLPGQHVGRPAEIPVTQPRRREAIAPICRQHLGDRGLVGLRRGRGEGECHV
jgi:hypothetical protein